MVEVTRRFTVRTPLPVVMAYLTDWGNSQEWDPGTITCTRIGDGPVRVSSEWRNVLRLLRWRVVVVFRLEDTDGDRLVFSGRNPPSSSSSPSPQKPGSR